MTEVQAMTPILPKPIASQPLLVIHLKGSQEEMGAQHGEIMKSLGGCEKTFEFYSHLTDRLLLHGMVPNNVRKPWFAKALKRFIDIWLNRLQNHRPELYKKRTAAFLDALGVAQSQARFMMGMDIFQNLLGVIGGLGLTGTVGGKAHAPWTPAFLRRADRLVIPSCSTLAVWGDASADGQLRHARNFDFPGQGVWDEAPTVVFCEPDDGLCYGFVTSRGCDVPGVTSYNEAGLVITFHTVMHRDVSFSGMSAVDLGHEIIRRARSISEAVEIARERPIASTWGIAISSAAEKRSITLETTAKATAVVTPHPGESFMATTNVYRDESLRQGEVVTSPNWPVHSINRERRMRAVAAAAQAGEGLSAENLQALLGDHVDFDDPSRQRAIGSVITMVIAVTSMVAEPESGRLRVSVGSSPTGWGPYREVAWNWTGKPGFQEKNENIQPKETSPENPYQRGKPGLAYGHYARAARLDFDGAEPADILNEMYQAVQQDPREPGYRFLLGILYLQEGAFLKALWQFESGLSHEKSAFRRGQLLLWGSRACSALGMAPRARAMADELMNLGHSHLGEYKSKVKKEVSRPISTGRLKRTIANFWSIDAY